MTNHEPTGFAKQIFKDRYAIHSEETFEQACKRVADYIAACEPGIKREEYFNKFFNILIQNRFCPGGRIWYGANRPKSQMMNCYVIDDEIDSREGWGETIKNIIIISGTGGGVGISFSKVRPRGTPIRGTGGESTGSVSLMKMINSACEELRAGGNRRSALMFCLHYNHPDIPEFLSVKLDKKQLNNANISITIDSKFLELLDNNENIVFEWLGEKYGEISAKELWDKLVKNSWESGDPGILNLEYANNMNNIYYSNSGKLVSTNPCVTGDTKIALADGRGAVSFKQLSNDGKDVPVYCKSPNGSVCIRIMRRPRISGFNKNIIKLTIDNKYILRTTRDHKFILLNGDIKEAKDLSVGDSLSTMSKIEAPFEYIIKNSNSKSSNYYWLKNNKMKCWKSEHRIIYEFFNNTIDSGNVIHHKDHNSLNNHIDNLQLISKIDHDRLHGRDMLGENNPMHKWYKNASPEEKKKI